MFGKCANIFGVIKDFNIRIDQVADKERLVKLIQDFKLYEIFSFVVRCAEILRHKTNIHHVLHINSQLALIYLKNV